MYRVALFLASVGLLGLCQDPTTHTHPAYDIPQLTAGQIAVLFDRPTNARQLLVNLKIAMDRDLLVQPTFYDDPVLLKFFGGSHVSSDSPAESRQTIKVMGDGGMSQMTFLLVRVQTCHEPSPADRSPQVYESGTLRIEVPPAAGLDVAAVKKVFGADPYERRSWSVPDRLGGATGSASLTYRSVDKERAPMPFAHHLIEFIPDESNRLTPTDQRGQGTRRIFANSARILSITVWQNERVP